jgi:hypothetical protein
LRVAISPLNARNPLKSPDSDEGILGNERNFKPKMQGKARKKQEIQREQSKTKICRIRGTRCGAAGQTTE